MAKESAKDTFKDKVELCLVKQQPENMKKELDQEKDQHRQSVEALKKQLEEKQQKLDDAVKDARADAVAKFQWSWEHMDTLLAAYRTGIMLRVCP